MGLSLNEPIIHAETGKRNSLGKKISIFILIQEIQLPTVCSLWVLTGSR